MSSDADLVAELRREADVWEADGSELDVVAIAAMRDAADALEAKEQELVNFSEWVDKLRDQVASLEMSYTEVRTQHAIEIERLTESDDDWKRRAGYRQEEIERLTAELEGVNRAFSMLQKGALVMGADRDRLLKENDDLKSLAAGDHEDNTRLRAALERIAKGEFPMPDIAREALAGATAPDATAPSTPSDSAATGTSPPSPK